MTTSSKQELSPEGKEETPHFQMSRSLSFSVTTESLP
jgi:hypothetical protein